MLVISDKQIKFFEDTARRGFEDKMMAHIQAFMPRYCRVLSEDGLREILLQAMQRAGDYGFLNKGPVRLYIELTFIYGSGFDTDPQLAFMSDVLNAVGDQMQRAEHMHAELVSYIDDVLGDNGTNIQSALQTLVQGIHGSFPVDVDNFEAEMLRQLARVFPEKAAYIGEAGLKALINATKVEAKKYNFSTDREYALLVILKYVLGHACTQDPLYPWISGILEHKKIKDPAMKGRLLEKKSIEWFNYILAEDVTV